MGAEVLDVPHPRDQLGEGVGLDQADALPAPGGGERPPALGGPAVPEAPAGEPEGQRAGVVLTGLAGEGSGEVFRCFGGRCCAGRFDGWRAHAVTSFRYDSRLPGQGRTPGDSRPYDCCLDEGCPYGNCPYGGAAIEAGRAWRPLPEGEPAKGRLAGRAATVVDGFGAVGTGCAAGTEEGSRPQSPRRRRAVIRVRTWAGVGCSHRWPGRCGRLAPSCAYGGWPHQRQPRGEGGCSACQRTLMILGGLLGLDTGRTSSVRLRFCQTTPFVWQNRFLKRPQPGDGTGRTELSPGPHRAGISEDCPQELQKVR